MNHCPMPPTKSGALLFNAEPPLEEILSDPIFSTLLSSDRLSLAQIQDVIGHYRDSLKH